jgi:Skp family chaperone for outer membrane proteins
MLRTAVIASSLVLLITSSAVAQEPTRVGAVSLAYVARTSNVGKSALAELDKFVKAKESAAAARASELEKQRLEMQKSNSALLQKAFERSRLDFERFQQDAQAEIQGMQAKFETEFRIKLAPVIDAVSKEKGLHFVFGLEQAAIVWWSPAVDISAEVAKRLDAAPKAP